MDADDAHPRAAIMWVMCKCQRPIPAIYEQGSDAVCIACGTVATITVKTDDEQEG